MVVQEVSEVVGDEVFSRHSQVKRIPVHELSPHVSVKSNSANFSSSLQYNISYSNPSSDIPVSLGNSPPKNTKSHTLIVNCSGLWIFPNLILDSKLQDHIPDSIFSSLRAIKHTSLQQMTNSIVCHIYCGVWQWLYQVLLIPWNFGAYVWNSKKW